MIQQSSNMATTAVFEETNTDFDTSLMEFFYSTTSEDALPDVNDTSSTTITEVANEIPSLFSYSIMIYTRNLIMNLRVGTI